MEKGIPAAYEIHSELIDYQSVGTGRHQLTAVGKY